MSASSGISCQLTPPKAAKSLENVNSKVTDNLLRDGELSKVVANHLRLDLNLVELLSRVDTNDRTNHLWDNDHVTEVSLDEVWLLIWLGLLLGLAKLFDQTHWLALKTTVEPATGTSVDDVAELVGGEVEETIDNRVSIIAPLYYVMVHMYVFEVWKTYASSSTPR